MSRTAGDEGRDRTCWVAGLIAVGLQPGAEGIWRGDKRPQQRGTGCRPTRRDDAQRRRRACRRLALADVCYHRGGQALWHSDDDSLCSSFPPTTTTTAAASPSSRAHPSHHLRNTAIPSIAHRDLSAATSHVRPPPRQSPTHWLVNASRLCLLVSLPMNPLLCRPCSPLYVYKARFSAYRQPIHRTSVHRS